MDVSLRRKEFKSYLSTKQLTAAFDHLSNASPEEVLGRKIELPFQERGKISFLQRPECLNDN